MASSKPPSATAQLKKFSVTMRMIANISHAREQLLSAMSKLNEVERFLYESLDIHPDDVPAPPSTKRPPNPSEMPTKYVEALSADTFERHFLATYKDTSSAADRENVRSVLAKARASNLINETKEKELLAKLKLT